MKTVEPTPAGSSFNVHDILFVLYHHKWKILFCSLVGIGAAAGALLSRKAEYRSTAKLLVPYIVTRSAVDSIDTQMSTAGNSTGALLEAEMAILTSRDVALEVVKNVGPSRFFKGRESISVEEAAGSILDGFDVSLPNHRGNIIDLAFQCWDPGLATEVLQELVDAYRVNHVKFRRGTEAFESVALETEEARLRLKAIEDELDELKSRAGIMSVEPAIAALVENQSRTEQEVRETEAELVEQEAHIRTLEAMHGLPKEEEPPIAEGPAPAVAAAAKDSVSALLEYQSLLDSIKVLRQDQRKLLGVYKAESEFVRINKKLLEEAEVRRQDLLKRNPGLESKAEKIDIARDAPGGPNLDLERAKHAKIEARLEFYKTQLTTLNEEYDKLYDMAKQVKELERHQEMEEQKLIYRHQEYEKARIDNALDPAKTPNIQLIQTPTTAIRTFESSKKIVLGLAAGGVGIGIGLAFLIEMFLDRRIKRPLELETRLHIPLMMEIPCKSARDQRPLLQVRDQPCRDSDLEPAEGEIILPDESVKGVPNELIPATDLFILPYTAALRDRIVCEFEMKGLVHKPKLVALAGLSIGAGTSTLAAGLARSFLGLGNSKVLLVDLNSPNAAESIVGDNNSYSLAGALEAGQQYPFNNGEGNLFVARAGLHTNGDMESSFAPAQLYELMPQFRASDFDYIIFDMPPIHQTSPTAAMAGFMDKFLLVLDSENTDREVVKRRHAELIRCKANVSCVFNKSRRKAPLWIQGEV